MISVITATFGSNRVKKVDTLFHQIKDTTTVPVQHIVIVDGNQETYDLLKAQSTGDTLLLAPRNVEWTKATNIGERFAKYPFVCSMDDDTTILIPDLFGKAIKIFQERFKDGRGILGLSNGEQNCPEWITTRKYAYSENLNHFIWPEYFHEGDHETYLKASRKGEYFWSPELKVQDVKFTDTSREKSLKCVEYDSALKNLREQQGFPNNPTDMSSIPVNERIAYLQANYYNE